MTDIPHSSVLLPETDDKPATASWNTIIVALTAILLVLAASHLTSQPSGDNNQVQNAEKSSGKLDGRGKWIGYM